jgi:hypothetical protein
MPVHVLLKYSEVLGGHVEASQACTAPEMRSNVHFIDELKMMSPSLGISDPQTASKRLHGCHVDERMQNTTLDICTNCSCMLNAKLWQQRREREVPEFECNRTICFIRTTALETRNDFRTFVDFNCLAVICAWKCAGCGSPPWGRVSTDSSATTAGAGAGGGPSCPLLLVRREH